MNGTLYWWKAVPVRGKGTIYFESDCENAPTVAKTACGEVRCNCVRLEEKPDSLLHQLNVMVHFSAPANAALAESRKIAIFCEGKL